jgi:LysM repeat protein
LVALAGALAWSPPAFAFQADSEAASAPSENFVHHTVGSGETIWKIADRYGASVASVIRENKIEDPSKIWVGTRLRIPVRATADQIVNFEQKVDTEDSEVAEIAALVERCEAELHAARFEEALATAAEARARIDARKGTAVDPGRVQLEIASATAYVALGQNDAALESLERALVANPDLELDPALTSPKVLAIFRVARGLANRTR